MDLIGQLAAVDLNLLVVFRVLDETRHVTEAAKRLGITQPALSHALNRLRALFDDRLFVRTPTGMAPTPRAQSLAVPVRDVLRAVGEKVLKAEQFKPEKLERVFRIRTTDWLEALLAPELVTRFEKAPGVQVALQPAGFSFPQGELESGFCDLGIAGFFGKMPSGFFQQKLFVDDFLCVVRSDHPLLRGSRSLSLEAYCRQSHILIAPGGELTGRVDLELKRQKRARRVAVGVSGFMSSLWAVKGSNCVMTAPGRLLTSFAEQVGLKVFSPPLKVPPTTIVQVWHERNHQDPAHRWLRESVYEALSD